MFSVKLVHYFVERYYLLCYRKYFCLGYNATVASGLLMCLYAVIADRQLASGLSEIMIPVYSAKQFFKKCSRKSAF